MDIAYISDDEICMNRYLEEHTEVVADQRQGWDILWKDQRAR